MRTCLLVMVVACGGGGSGSDESTALEGVYNIDTWTQNPTACDAEGASVLDHRPTLFYIKSENLRGIRFLNVNPCASVAECQAQAQDDSVINLGQWGFDIGSDDSGWRSDNTFAFELNGTCEATHSVTTMTASGDTVHIEQRDQKGTFPPDATNDCPGAQALSSTRDAPCATLEVATATFNATF